MLVNVNSSTYLMYYKINMNIIYLITTHKEYPCNSAFSLLTKINIEFTKEIKNRFGVQKISYLKLEKIDKN